jgi:hypothetical protein
LKGDSMIDLFRGWSIVSKLIQQFPEPTLAPNSEQLEYP